jgi:hypothetical protein
MRFASLLLGALLAAAAPARAQFFDFLADWSDVETMHGAFVPSDKRPLLADVTSTLKAATPWGEISTVENGKYWRNSQGQDRFDDAYGLSEMRDRRGPVIRARIDRELRLVEIEEKIAPRAFSGSRPDPWSILPFSFKKGPVKMVDGLTVTVRTGYDHGVTYEVWTSDELGLVVFARYKTDHTVFEQHVQNIRFEEPSAALFDFSVPAGFRTRITCSPIDGPERDAPRQSYEPGRSSCAGDGQ